MRKFYGLLGYIALVLLQYTNAKDDFAEKIFARIEEAEQNATKACPKEIKPNQIKLMIDGSKKFGAGMRITMEKISKWEHQLTGKKDDLPKLETQLKHSSGNINRAADFNNIKNRKKSQDNDLLDVLRDSIKQYMQAVSDFVNSLRTKAGKIRTAADDVVTSFESSVELFVEDMEKVEKAPEIPVN